MPIRKSKKTIIKVIGVGGGGSNAVNNMFHQGIIGVDFAIANTDAQAMEGSDVPIKIQLGPELTDGNGAGSKPNVGKQACEESIDEIKNYLSEDTRMVFITAGMGGGTGTGAAPVIAKVAQELGILTVGIVTVPFTFEGSRRTRQAIAGLEELKKNVDTFIVISNDRLQKLFGNMALRSAFAQADNILTTAAKGIAEIITVGGYVNVDFEDVNTVMRNSGVAIMASAEAGGDDRAKRAVEGALNSPLLEDNDIKGAKNILLNMSTGSKEITMDEVNQITEYIQKEAGFGTDLIWGNCHDKELGESLSVTIIATGFETDEEKKKELGNKKNSDKIVVHLDDDILGNEKKIPDTLYDKGYIEGESAKVVDFDIQNVIKKQQMNKYSYDDPYIKEEREQKENELERENATRKRIQEERNKRMGLKLNNPKVINELENEPAYLRRKVKLDDLTPSSEESKSEWTITDDEEKPLKKKNSFLHDNVD